MPVVSPRAMPVALALAALAATAGCGSGNHESAHKAAVANATAAPRSHLRGKIVFRRFLDDTKTGLYVLGIGAGVRPRLVADFGYRADVGGATWSPEGKTIVFSAHNNGPGKPAEGSALFAVGADGRGLRRLTSWETAQQI